MCNLSFHRVTYINFLLMSPRYTIGPNKRLKSSVNGIFGWFVFGRLDRSIALVCLIRNVHLSCKFLWHCPPVSDILFIMITKQGLYTNLSQTNVVTSTFSTQSSCACRGYVAENVLATCPLTYPWISSSDRMSPLRYTHGRIYCRQYY